jgi:hypothetical protein
MAGAMSDLEPTIGIVIVSYNTGALLADCLHSLRACRLPLHILVVDNASTDNSTTMVRARFPDVHLCALDQNVGFAAANNIGLRWFGYGSKPSTSAPHRPAYVLLLNPDTVVHTGAIETLVQFLRAHPRIGLVGPRLLNPDGSIQTAAFRFPTLSMSLLDVFPPGEVLPGRLYASWWNGRYPEETAVPAIPFPIDHPLGACLLVRGRVVEQVGLLDEHYFMYSEEIDWCWRIRQAGWAIWQVPQAHVTHIGGASTGQFRQRMLVELHRSRVRFFHQHYSPLFLRVHSLITTAGMLRLIVLVWWAWLCGRTRRDELRARTWAYATIMRVMASVQRLSS